MAKNPLEGLFGKSSLEGGLFGKSLLGEGLFGKNKDSYIWIGAIWFWPGAIWSGAIWTGKSLTVPTVCFTLPIEVSAGPEKVLKKRGAKGLFGPSVKTDEITARPFWG